MSQKPLKGCADAKVQREQVAADLLAGRKVTALACLKRHGIGRLAARILELRQAGWDIPDYFEGHGRKRWKVYYMTAAGKRAARAGQRRLLPDPILPWRT